MNVYYIRPLKSSDIDIWVKTLRYFSGSHINCGLQDYHCCDQTTAKPSDISSQKALNTQMERIDCRNSRSLSSFDYGQNHSSQTKQRSIDAQHNATRDKCNPAKATSSLKLSTLEPPQFAFCSPINKTPSTTEMAYKCVDKPDERRAVLGLAHKMTIAPLDFSMKSRDELLLLLLQLNREKANLARWRTYFTDKIKALNEHSSSNPSVARDVEILFKELKNVESQLSLFQPLVSFLENTTRIADLYAGDDRMFVEEYKSHHSWSPKVGVDFMRQLEEREVARALDEVGEAQVPDRTQSTGSLCPLRTLPEDRRYHDRRLQLQSQLAALDTILAGQTKRHEALSGSFRFLGLNHQTYPSSLKQSRKLPTPVSQRIRRRQMSALLTAGMTPVATEMPSSSITCLPIEVNQFGRSRSLGDLPITSLTSKSSGVSKSIQQFYLPPSLDSLQWKQTTFLETAASPTLPVQNDRIKSTPTEQFGSVSNFITPDREIAPDLAIPPNSQLPQDIGSSVSFWTEPSLFSPSHDRSLFTTHHKDSNGPRPHEASDSTGGTPQTRPDRLQMIANELVNKGIANSTFQRKLPSARQNYQPTGLSSWRSYAENLSSIPSDMVATTRCQKDPFEDSESLRATPSKRPVPQGCETNSCS